MKATNDDAYQGDDVAGYDVAGDDDAYYNAGDDDERHEGVLRR